MAEPFRVVVSAMAVRAGTARDLAGFAAMLRQGRSAVRRIAPGEQTGLPAGRLGAPLPADDVMAELAAALPQAARALRGASRAAMWSVLVGLEALDAAGLDVAERDETGVVIAGSNIGQAQGFAAGDAFRRQPAYTPVRHGFEVFDTHLASVLAECAGLHGPGLSVGGASASGNSGLLVAADLIRLGRAAACLVVGPSLDLSPVEWQALDAMGALAPEHAPACLPLDARACGLAPSEACAAVVLETLDHVHARGGRPLAEIAGGAMVLSGRHGAAPDAGGELRAMRRALGRLPVAELGVIGAHATGTPAGDAVECRAIAELLGPHCGAVAVNAVKSLTGHPIQAAGLLGLLALVLQMQGDFLHGTAGLEQPIAAAEFGLGGLALLGPCAVARETEWALNNAFGFGGIDTCLLLRNGHTLR